MTSTNSKVSRVTPDSYRILYSSKAKPIVVTIYKDTLSFREKRGKKSYSLPIPDVFKWAVRVEANRERAEKKAARKSRRILAA